ncbi:MAG: hypothetical protein DLM61_14885, partial [Pseudonocardiales bacterium]
MRPSALAWLAGLAAELLLVAINIAVNIVTGSAFSRTSGAVWIALGALIAATVALGIWRQNRTTRATPVAATADQAAEAIRQTTLRESAEPNSSKRATPKLDDQNLGHIIPLRSRYSIDYPWTRHEHVENFTMTIATAPRKFCWVMKGSPGSGKTTLLHSIARTVCTADTPDAAIVISLATYDWETDSIRDWSASMIAELAKISANQVKQLIDDKRLLVLLDGLDEVPDKATLEDRLFPRTELPFFDRFFRTENRQNEDPRKQLVLKIQALPWFILATRTDRLSHEELSVLDRLRTVELNDIPRATADTYLRHIIPSQWHVDDRMQEVIQRPLYLQLLLFITKNQCALPTRQQGGLFTS